MHLSSLHTCLLCVVSLLVWANSCLAASSSRLAAAATTSSVRTNTNCTLGADVATPVSEAGFHCMIVHDQLQFVVIRAFQSNCYLDPHTVDTIRAAGAAGLSVDIYFFPSVGCTMSPIQQVDLTLTHLQNNAALFNTLWVDVEAWSWWDDCATNIAYLSEFMSHLVSVLGRARVGIYTGRNFYLRAFCNSPVFAQQFGVALWYARWDAQPNFADFLPFGGWTTPTAKQYADSGGCTAVNYDLDYRDGACQDHLRLQPYAVKQALPVPTSPNPPAAATATKTKTERETERETEAEAEAETAASGAPVALRGGNCTLGVDLATPVSIDAFECVREALGAQFLVVRAFQSNCYIDPHVVDTIHAATAAGLSVDIYFFPSIGCALDGPSQIDAALANLAAGNATFGRLFIDVETWSWYDQLQCADNEKFLTSVVQRAVERLGVARVGIYTVKSMWERIVCASSSSSSRTLFPELLLWYARWDHVPSFANYTQFGGWDTPFMKQYLGNGHLCDINLDFNYRQSGVC